MNLGQEIQTVLVTGGTGFIGGAVAQRLRSENCTVRALVRPNSDTAALTAAGCELCFGDITDAESVSEAMEGVDAVVHCAAFASDWGPIETFVRVNVSNGKICRELGFSPRVLPEAGLARTIEWLKSVDLSKIKTK